MFHTDRKYNGLEEETQRRGDLSSTSQGQNPSHTSRESDGKSFISTSRFLKSLVGLVQDSWIHWLIIVKQMGKRTSVIRTVGETTTYFKAITVERTNSLDIHKVTQYRLSMRKEKQKTFTLPQPSSQENRNCATHSVQKDNINQKVWDGCSWCV